MLSRRRFFALPGVFLAALPQMPFERHDQQPPMTPEVVTSEIYRLGAVTSAHTGMHAITNNEVRRIWTHLQKPGWWKPRGSRTT